MPTDPPFPKARSAATSSTWMTTRVWRFTSATACAGSRTSTAEPVSWSMQQAGFASMPACCATRTVAAPPRSSPWRQSRRSLRSRSSVCTSRRTLPPRVETGGCSAHPLPSEIGHERFQGNLGPPARPAPDANIGVVGDGGGRARRVGGRGLVRAGGQATRRDTLRSIASKSPVDNACRFRRVCVESVLYAMKTATSPSHARSTRPVVEVSRSPTDVLTQQSRKRRSKLRAG